MLLVKTGLLFCHPNFLSLQSSVEKAMLWQNGSRESKSYLLLDWFLLLSFLLLILRMGRLISLLKRKRKEKKKKQNIRRNESKEGNLSIQSDPIRSDPPAFICIVCTGVINLENLNCEHVVDLIVNSFVL